MDEQALTKGSQCTDFLPALSFARRFAQAGSAPWPSSHPSPAWVLKLHHWCKGTSEMRNHSTIMLRVIASRDRESGCVWLDDSIQFQCLNFSYICSGCRPAWLVHVGYAAFRANSCSAVWVQESKPGPQPWHQLLVWPWASSAALPHSFSILTVFAYPPHKYRVRSFIL